MLILYKISDKRINHDPQSSNSSPFPARPPHLLHIPNLRITPQALHVTTRPPARAHITSITIIRSAQHKTAQPPAPATQWTKSKKPSSPPKHPSSTKPPSRTVRHSSPLFLHSTYRPARAHLPAQSASPHAANRRMHPASWKTETN